MHARVLASPRLAPPRLASPRLASPRRGKSASEHETGADFSKFPARVARRAYPTNSPNDEPRDVPFKVSGIRLPKKTWTNGPAEVSLSLSLSPRLSVWLSSSSSNMDAHGGSYPRETRDPAGKTRERRLAGEVRASRERKGRKSITRARARASSGFGHASRLHVS